MVGVRRYTKDSDGDGRPDGIDGERVKDDAVRGLHRLNPRLTKDSNGEALHLSQGVQHICTQLSSASRPITRERCPLPLPGDGKDDQVDWRHVRRLIARSSPARALANALQKAAREDD